MRKIIQGISLIVLCIMAFFPLTSKASETIEKEFQKEVSKLNLPEQQVDFDYTYEIDEDGFKGEIPRISISYNLDEINTIDNRMAEITKVINHGIWPTKPIHEDNINVVYYDADTDMHIEVVVPYTRTRTTKQASPVDWHTAQFTHYIAEDDNYLIYGTIDKFDINSDKPQFTGYEENIVKMLNLSTELYTVVNSRWITDKQQNQNGKMRVAEYTLAEIVTQYESIYSTTIPLDTIYKYTATATYKGTLTQVIETFTDLEPQVPESNIAEIAIVTGGTIIIIVCSMYMYKSKNVIFYAIEDEKKRRLGNAHVKKKDPMKIDCTKYYKRLYDGESLQVLIKKKTVLKTQGFTVQLKNDDYDKSYIIEGDEAQKLIL